MKGGVIGVTLIGIVGIGRFFTNDGKLLLILALGVVFILGLVCLGIWLERRMIKRKSAALGRDVSRSKAPDTISKADQLVQLDAMRRAFEDGVRKFKDAKRSLYSIPWYLVVGEPSGGKSELIRRCQLKMVPGLQDPLQGIGGTINMN